MANKRSTYYMSVTPDKYELPIYAPDTVEELAAYHGVDKKNIYNSVSKNNNGKLNGFKFVKVKDDDEDN